MHGVHSISSSVLSEVCELWRAHRQDTSLDVGAATHAEVHIWGEAGYALQFLERRVTRHSTHALPAKDLVVRCVTSAGLGLDEQAYNGHPPAGKDGSSPNNKKGNSGQTKYQNAFQIHYNPSLRAQLVMLAYTAFFTPSQCTSSRSAA